MGLNPLFSQKKTFQSIELVGLVVGKKLPTNKIVSEDKIRISPIIPYHSSIIFQVLIRFTSLLHILTLLPNYQVILIS